MGLFDDRCFSYVAAFGAFTDVAYLTPQEAKMIFGKTAYIAEAAKRLPSLSPIEANVIADDRLFHERYIFGMVANSKTVGGIRFFDGNGADDLRDGLLEVLLIPYPNSTQELQESLVALFTPKATARIRRIRASEIHFHFETPTPWTLDGEFGGNQESVAIRCLPRHLHIIE